MPQTKCQLQYTINAHCKADSAVVQPTKQKVYQLKIVC